MLHLYNNELTMISQLTYYLWQSTYC